MKKLDEKNKQSGQAKPRLFTREVYLIFGSATGIVAAKIVSWLLRVLLS